MISTSSVAVSEPLSIASLPVAERMRRALSDMREGRPVLLLDDFDRENEADLIVAAEKITVPAMDLLIRECSGIVCLCMPEEDLQRLNLPMMVANNESPYQTGFTVSVEARHGVTTGVSAKDRTTTILTAVAEGTTADDLVRPGHVFPLRAMTGGVFSRRGHTEGSVDLAVLAGLRPAAVLCELTNPDGTMTKGEQIDRFAEEHDLVAITIEEIVEYRQEHDIRRS